MGYGRMKVMNNRGHVRRAVFQKVEEEHLRDRWEREIFLQIMTRDYSVPEYFMPSASSKGKAWAISYNNHSTYVPRECWDQLEKRELIKLESYSHSYSIYPADTRSHVNFSLRDKGQLFVVKKTLELNIVLWGLAHPGRPYDDLEYLRAVEDECLGIKDIRRMDRYIRN